MHIDFHLIFYAIIQGVTEFLPISSTAHLKLLEWWGMPLHVTTSLAVLLHVGSCLALVVYFWRLLWRLIYHFFTPRIPMTYYFDAWHIILASLPAVIGGAGVVYLWGDPPQSMLLIGLNSVIFGSLLIMADRGPVNSAMNKALGMKGALGIGIAQMLSLIPGASRAGTTIMAGRFLGLTRHKSIEFSFVLAIPVIFGAALLKLPQVVDAHLPWDVIVQAVGASFISSLITVFVFFRLVGHMTMMPFGLYRILLGFLMMMASL